MLSLSLLTLPVALFSTASAIVLPPSSELPFDISIFQRGAVACQNTNCGDKLNAPGTVLWDMTINATMPYAVDGEQRVNIYTTESDEQRIIVAYEGKNGTNADSNLKVAEFWQSRADPVLGIATNAYVYHGIQEQFLASWKELKEPLSKVINDNPGKKVLVVGHSAGASISQLAALAIQNTFGDVISNVISYGPTRVGNPQWAHEFDRIFLGRYAGVINGNDFVTRLPLEIMNYRRPSGLVWINPANSTNYNYFTNGEDLKGPDGQLPPINLDALFHGKFGDVISWGNHLGWYFGVHMNGRMGDCPARPPYLPANSTV